MGEAADSTVDVDILRAVESTCSAYQTVNQISTCEVLAKNCKTISLQCGNIAQQTYICTNDQAGEAIAGALLSRAEARDVDLRPVLGLAADAPAVDIKTAIREHITTTCGGTQEVGQIISTQFDCSNSSDIVVTALNRVDQSTLCSIVTAAALYDTASGGLEPRGSGGAAAGGFVPVPPPVGSDLATVIGIVCGTVVALIIVIVCGVLIRTPRRS
jgi:hypothetical protein